MDEKIPLLPSHTRADDDVVTPSTMRQSRTFRHKIATAAILLGILWLARTWFYVEEPPKQLDRKVPLDVHIMSKCPDARACLQELVVPSMARVSDKVAFRISFIGNVTDADDGVQCKHGQTECLGNILILCAAAQYPDPKLHLGFANCLIDDYRRIPEQPLIEDCALEHGLDFEVLNDCMSRDTGAYGMGLLRESVLHSQAVNASLSCTVRLDEKSRCIYDNGEWKNCEGGSEPDDLVRDIERLYDQGKGES